MQENVEKLKKTARELNPGAKVIVTDSVVTVADADAIRGKKVVLVEDGPTLTHGGMPYGAGNYHPMNPAVDCLSHTNPCEAREHGRI